MRHGAAPLLAFLLLAAAGASADEPRRSDFSFGIDVGFVDAAGYPSFLNGSAGKLRFDGETDGFVLDRAWFDYRYRLADTLVLQVAGEVYDDDLGSSLGLTEAFVEWKPLASSPTRYRLKAGAFYPRVSLENVDKAWSSPYTISSSAINTWLGEEFRAFGAELGLSRRPQSLGGQHTFSVFGSVFLRNDPAGTLLSWKGWSLHDRQTRIGDELPLPRVPQLEPGGAFTLQAPYLDPFVETDDAAGWYAGAEWAMGRRLLVRVVHYDNEADPVSYQDGQFGWTTVFDALGVQATLPGDIGLIAQWMGGSTVWGRYYEDRRYVEAGFDSAFLLLTRRMGRHRVSLRHDRFEVSDDDRFPMDDNSERGDAWTVSYRFDWTDRVAVAAEWLEVFSRRPAWEYLSLDDANTEIQVQLALQLRFGP